MRRALKIALAVGLAGSGFTGYLLWRELFVLHGTPFGATGYAYGGFVFLVLGAIIGLRAVQPRTLAR